MVEHYRSTVAGGGLTKAVSAIPACDACGAALELDFTPDAGEILDCENCGVELEVLSADPLKTQVFEEEEK